MDDLINQEEACDVRKKMPMPDFKITRHIDVEDIEIEKLPQAKVMNDLIYRQLTIDVIDSISDDPIAWLESAIEVVKNLPSVQSEIIHCRDCRFWQDQEEGIVEVPICARPENKYDKFPHVMLIDGDGFCSYAERREDG